MDASAFLARYPPFHGLAPDLLEAVAGEAAIEFFPAGAEILHQAGQASRFLYVVRSGAVEISDGGRTVDVLGEGEAFGHLSLLSRLHPSATVRAGQDTLCYLIPRAMAERVLGSPKGLAFFSAEVQRWALRAEGETSGDQSLRRVRAGSLVRRPLVTCPPEATVAEAARIMAGERISSLLVPAAGGWGILTDRDLRTRVLAAGRPPDAPVSEVMSFPARTVSTGAMAAEVLIGMLEGGFHHFPVVDDAGQVIGVVTDTDLMGLERQSPVALKSAIERAAGEDEAIAEARRLPETVVALVRANVDPVDVGYVVGVTLDALTRRLLDLAIARLGEPPVPWAWLALGSQARHEQALHTDQDHAMAFESGGSSTRDGDLDELLAGLAEAVTSGLEAAGIVRCNGDAMAVNPALRRSVEGWKEALRRWMSDPGVEGSIFTSITFDYRRVAGPLDVEPAFDEVVRSAPAHYPQFLRHLARRALDRRPPTGFFRDLVVEARGEHAGRLDVKHGGITIIGNLARTYAIREGRTEKGTLDRLRGAVDSGQIDEETREALEESFRLLWRTRLEHQAACVQAGRKADDFVDPSSLGPIRRRGLKESFRLIAREQKTLAADLGVR